MDNLVQYFMQEAIELGKNTYNIVIEFITH